MLLADRLGDIRFYTIGISDIPGKGTSSTIRIGFLFILSVVEQIVIYEKLVNIVDDLGHKLWSVILKSFHKSSLIGRVISGFFIY